MNGSFLRGNGSETKLVEKKKLPGRNCSSNKLAVGERRERDVTKLIQDYFSKPNFQEEFLLSFQIGKDLSWGAILLDWFYRGENEIERTQCLLENVMPSFFATSGF